LGRKGTGKSTMARSLISEAHRNIILDTLGDDYSRGAITSNVQRAAEYYNRVNEYGAFELVYRPRNDNDIEHFFSFARQTANTVLWVDEVDRYCGPHSINENLKWILNYGRHRQISTIGIARRAASVHRDLSANADWIVVHQTRENRDLQYLSEFMDVGGLETLERFEFKYSGKSSLFDWRKFGVKN